MKACLQSGRTRVGDLGNLVAVVTIPRPVSATVSLSDVDKFFAPTMARSSLHKLRIREPPNFPNDGLEHQHR